jgi:hypothetical protein
MIAERLRRGGVEVSAVGAAHMVDLRDPLAPEEPTFLGRVVGEFSIPEPSALAEVIEVAAMAYDGSPRFAELQRESAACAAAALEDFAAAVSRARAAYQNCRQLIAPALLQSRVGATEDEVAARVDELLAALEKAAGAARPERRGRRRNAVRSMVNVLTRYWIYRLDRPFTSDHRWSPGPGGIGQPHTLADRFVYAIVEYLAPGNGEGLATALRGISRTSKSRQAELRKNRGKQTAE